MNTFPLFKQNKSYQSSILTLIIITTSAIIPTINTIINKTTNIKHPPYNTRGLEEGMAYRGAWLISKEIK